MSTPREEDLFLAFKRRPDAGALAALLRGYQDHIYNISFQVLRHPEDAEDVAQEVLIETARTIGRIESPRQFKVWLYKVALHSALKLKETRARRVALAQKLATLQPAGGGDMDTEERAALLRAIGDLDDRSRCMLLEHYFDKLTLEEIGAREGVSSVAVWKRLDRAKERLRRALGGFAVAAALDSISPAAAPPTLTAKAALIAAEGVLVGTKSAVSGGAIVAAILVIGATATGGYVVGSRRTAGDSARIRELEAQVAVLVRAKPTTSVRVLNPMESPPKAADVPPIEAAPEPRKADKTMILRACELWVRTNSPFMTAEERCELYRLFALMDESWSAVLAPQYKETEAKLTDQDRAFGYRSSWPIFNLMIQCGGQGLADLYYERLTSPEVRAGERQRLLSNLNSSNWDFAYAEKLPIDSRLESLAGPYAVSTDPLERSAAAGILGGVPWDRSGHTLTVLLEDPEFRVRTEAVRAIARAGDSVALAELARHAKSHVSRSGDNEFRKALDMSIQYMHMRLARKH